MYVFVLVLYICRNYKRMIICTLYRSDTQDIIIVLLKKEGYVFVQIAMMEAVR